ncbi:MAG TPA: flagellar hook-associated protein FlgL [Candidatus Baltobacteraceae bacterium]|jgi:flagellar hook-associated protein 3 FlgL|nr:flagellar hook-associated protein FlgL [Candidatus Baltobacteraceae bacterium]
MRIATSTMYDNQTIQIDNLVAQQQQQGTEASTGVQLNGPSDDPMQIATDLQVRTTIAQENQANANIQNATTQLTTVDGAMSTLTSIMQSARGIAVQAAGGFTSPTQQSALASQVDSLLQEAIGVANTKYNGQYVFGGTSGGSTSGPVTPNGQPISSVTFNGNLNQQNEKLFNGQSLNTSVSLQQAFNFQSPDGSPDIFQTLITLRDTIQNGTVTSESAAGVNSPNTAFTGGAGAQAINTAGILSTALTPDANGNVDIQILSAKAPAGVTIAIPATDTVPQVLTAINAQTAATGVTASFDYRQQRLTLSSNAGNFSVTDVASAGAPTPGNFVEAFGLQSQANLQNDVSRQLGDIDHATQVMLNARSSLGGTLQTLNAIGTANSSQVVNDTKVQSGIEDADIAKVISQFSQTQTVLQAAYATTTRLESKTLFDYLQ